MSDLRSPLAKARDEWLESRDGKVCLSTNILSDPNQQQFLRNRLMSAFIAGANWNSDDLKSEFQWLLENTRDNARVQHRLAKNLDR